MKRTYIIQVELDEKIMEKHIIEAARLKSPKTGQEKTTQKRYFGLILESHLKKAKALKP